MTARTAKPRVMVLLGAVAAVAVIVAGTLLVIVVWFFTRGGSSAPTAVTTTPDGQQWTLATQLNPDGTRIALISDTNNQVVFTGSLRFSDYSRWFVHGGEREFWIYSGDIGVLHYTLHPDGTWRETSARSSTNVAMPRAFYEALPESTRRHVRQESIGP